MGSKKKTKVSKKAKALKRKVTKKTTKAKKQSQSFLKRVTAHVAKALGGSKPAAKTTTKSEAKKAEVSATVREYVAEARKALGGRTGGGVGLIYLKDKATGKPVRKNLSSGQEALDILNKIESGEEELYILG